MTAAVRTLAGILALLVVVWGAGALFPSEERRIRQRLDELAETASMEAGEPPLVRMSRAARIGRHFTENVVVDLGDPFRLIRGREAAIGAAARIPVRPEGVTFEFVDVQVVVAPDEQTATVRLTAQGSGLDVGTGDQVIDARELDMTLRQLAGEWLIGRVDGIEVIERPGGGDSPHRAR